MTRVADRSGRGPGQLTPGCQPRAATMFGHHPALWARSRPSGPVTRGAPRDPGRAREGAKDTFACGQGPQKSLASVPQPPTVVVCSWPWGHEVGSPFSLQLGQAHQGSRPPVILVGKTSDKHLSDLCGVPDGDKCRKGGEGVQGTAGGGLF